MLLPRAGLDGTPRGPRLHRNAAKVSPSYLPLVALDSKHNAWATKWHTTLLWYVVCGGWRGEVHRDVSKPLSVYLASVPCMHEMQYAK